MDETGSNDIEVTPEDFDGEFDINEYISSPELELYEKGFRDRVSRHLVIIGRLAKDVFR